MYISCHQSGYWKQTACPYYFACTCIYTCALYRLVVWFHLCDQMWVQAEKLYHAWMHAHGYIMTRWETQTHWHSCVLPGSRRRIWRNWPETQPRWSRTMWCSYPAPTWSRHAWGTAPVCLEPRVSGVLCCVRVWSLRGIVRWCQNKIWYGTVCYKTMHIPTGLIFIAYNITSIDRPS